MDVLRPGRLSKSQSNHMRESGYAENTWNMVKKNACRGNRQIVLTRQACLYSRHHSGRVFFKLFLCVLFYFALAVAAAFSGFGHFSHFFEGGSAVLYGLLDIFFCDLITGTQIFLPAHIKAPGKGQRILWPPVQNPAYRDFWSHVRKARTYGSGPPHFSPPRPVLLQTSRETAWCGNP